MDQVYQPRRRPSRATSSTGYPQDDAVLPLRGGAWPPARRLNETKTLLASPGPLESMLKTTTETGDIGIFSMGPSRSNNRMRTPYHPTMGPARGLPSRTMSVDAAYRRHLRDDRRGLPSYRDTSSDIVSLYGRNHSGPASFSRSLDDAGPRSYSLTSCSSRILSDQKSTSTSESRSSGADGAPQARPRSPYPYHTRLKRPGVRPISPAITSDGIIDYSRMVEIDRPSYRTVHRSSSRAYPPHSRPAHPRSRSGEDRKFQSLACDVGRDYMPRRRYAVPEIPPGWTNKSRYLSENVPSERNDQNSTITSLVNLYTHSRTSSVVRQPPPVSRMGSFYYDYSEGFEDMALAQRNITACEPISPMPRRSATMNRPKVLDDNCEPFLVTGTIMDDHMLSALHEHPLSGVSSPHLPGAGTEGRADPETNAKAEADGQHAVSDTCVRPTPAPQEQICPAPASAEALAPAYNLLDTSSAVSDHIKSVSLITGVGSPSNDTYTSSPKLCATAALVDTPGAALLVAVAATASIPDCMAIKNHVDSQVNHSGSHCVSGNSSSLNAIPEHLSQETATQTTPFEDTKHHSAVLQLNAVRLFIRSTESPGSVDSRRLLDVSFASTADCSSSGFRDTEAGTTPTVSQPTGGGCLDEEHGCNASAIESFTPTADRKSERFSLQSGLSHLKSFVQDLDNAGLLRDEEVSTFLMNGTRRTKLLDRLAGSPDTSNLLSSTENLLANGGKPAIAASSKMGHDSDAQRRKPPTTLARVSTSEWLTDLTFDSRTSIDYSNSVRDRAMFMKALPSLPLHGMDARNTNQPSKSNARGALRIPQRLSSFPAISRPEQKHHGYMESLSGKRQEISDSGAATTHDTSLTYGASGICAVIPAVQQWGRREISPMTLQGSRNQGHIPASAEQSLQVLKIHPPTHAAPRSTVPVTAGMTGRFKSNTVRVKPTTSSIPSARSVGRRVSCEANISTSRFTEALPSEKRLPPKPSHQRQAANEAAHGSHPRRLKKSFSNLRMRLADSRVYSQGQAMSENRLLVKDGERIGVGVPVTATATITSSNSTVSIATMEDVELRGLRNRIARWVRSAKKAVHSCRRLSSSTTGNTSLDTDF